MFSHGVGLFNHLNFSFKKQFWLGISTFTTSIQFNHHSWNGESFHSQCFLCQSSMLIPWILPHLNSYPEKNDAAIPAIPLFRHFQRAAMGCESNQMAVSKWEKMGMVYPNNHFPYSSHFESSLRAAIPFSDTFATKWSAICGSELLQSPRLHRVAETVQLSGTE